MKYILNIKLAGPSVASTRPLLYDLLDRIPIITIKMSSCPPPNSSPPDYGMTFHSVLVDATEEDLTALKLTIPDLVILPDMGS